MVLFGGKSTALSKDSGPRTGIVEPVVADDAEFSIEADW